MHYLYEEKKETILCHYFLTLNQNPVIMQYSIELEASKNNKKK